MKSTKFIWHRTSQGPIEVNLRDRAQVIATVRERIRSGTGFALATLNLDHLVKMRRDRGFADAYKRHDLICADGNPIVWLCRLAGQDMSLVPGSDLIEPLTALASDQQTPVAFFGSDPETLDSAADALHERYPGLQIALKLAPPMGFDPTGEAADQAIEDIKASGARVVFLALGAPKQEIFAARAAQSIADAGFVSIGAGLDFIAGTQSRAPRWVRVIAAEWLWRLIMQPRRLAGRYLDCVMIFPGLALSAWQARRAD